MTADASADNWIETTLAALTREEKASLLDGSEPGERSDGAGDPLIRLARFPGVPGFPVDEEGVSAAVACFAG